MPEGQRGKVRAADAIFDRSPSPICGVSFGIFLTNGMDFLAQTFLILRARKQCS